MARAVAGLVTELCVRATAPKPYQIPSGRLWIHSHSPMDRRTITLELSTAQIQHLDAQAAYLGCSRAAYIRQLVVRDQERQGAVTRTSTNHAIAA